MSEATSALEVRISLHLIRIPLLILIRTSPSQNAAQPSPVYTIDLNELSRSGKMLDLSEGPTAERYHFAECEPLAEDGILRIQEYTDLPTSYAAVSYVWEGLNRLPGDESPAFLVRPTDPAYPSDPITINVVQNACKAALKRGIKLLWLDRFSIMQSIAEDQKWQIARMYDIYKHCALCIVIPSGLGRLSSLGEPTNWIQRGWTLQEAVAPEEVQVLFSWGDHRQLEGKSSFDQDTGPKDRITIVTYRKCAMAPLRLILDCCITGKLFLVHRFDPYYSFRLITETYKEPVAIFGVSSKGYTPDDYRAVLPNVAMLAAIKSGDMSGHRDQMQHCLWKSTFLRTTRYPADAIFSIMGLFGVTLNTHAFDLYDPIRPAVALAQQILLNGDGATWLGASFHSLPCPRLSTFPSFPKVLDERANRGSLKKLLVPSTTGYVDISRIVLNEYVDAEFLIPMPRGRMDVNGYFTFRARSVPVTRASSDLAPNSNSKTCWQPERSIISTDGSVWQCKDTSSPDAFAVLLGCFFPYDPASPPPWDLDNIRGLIVKKHAPGRFHVHSYFMLTIRATDWVMDNWKEHELCVGGPHSLDAAQMDEPDLENLIKLPKIDKTITFNNLGSKHFKGVEGYPLVEGGPWREGLPWSEAALRTLREVWGNY
ncbi:hypothetical protein FRC09_002134 [Ceratobasidium sp. 395]|nr:hypothetical protein FRC09_002134 [Ceratobasidium sp. 395]